MIIFIIHSSDAYFHYSMIKCLACNKSVFSKSMLRLVFLTFKTEKDN